MGYILMFIVLKVTFESERESDVNSGLERLVGLKPAYFYIFLIELRIYFIQTRGDSRKFKKKENEDCFSEFYLVYVCFLYAMQKWRLTKSACAFNISMNQCNMLNLHLLVLLQHVELNRDEPP